MFISQTGGDDESKPGCRVLSNFAAAREMLTMAVAGLQKCRDLIIDRSRMRLLLGRNSNQKLVAESLREYGQCPFTP